MKFEVSLIFLIKPFYMNKKKRKKIEHLENEKSI